MLVSKVSRLQLEKTELKDSKDSKAHCFQTQSVAAAVAVVDAAEQLWNVAPVS